MNKITTNTTCACCDTDTILKIVAGNDFSLRITLTYKEDDVTQQYDLSDVEDLDVYVVSPTGERILLDSHIDEYSRITAVVDAQKFDTYTPYDIEVVWRDDTYDKRAVATHLLTFVNSSQEANDAQEVITDGPYDYNLEILSDIALVTIGEMPDIYITQQELDETLSSYVTNSTLDTTLSSYATIASTDLKIETLWNDANITFIDENELDSTLSSYINKDTLDTTLDAYATIQYVDDALSNIDLQDYYTKSDIDTTLTSYVKNSDLDTILASYVKQDDLDTTLTSYVKDTELTPIQNDISSLDGRVTTLENNPAVPSNVVTCDDATYIYMLTQSEYDTLEQGGQLDADTFYYITDTTNNYLKRADVDTLLLSYVKQDDLDVTLTSYVKDSELTTALTPIQNDISSLDGRVTTLEQSGGGGGSVDLSSYVTYTYWDNTNEAIAYELTNNRLDHLTINNTFNNYYTKTEADGRYATQSWANNKFVTQADDVNRQEAIAAAFSYTVMSDTIHNIWRGSQSDYDLLTPDADTLYIII